MLPNRGGLSVLPCLCLPGTARRLNPAPGATHTCSSSALLDTNSVLSRGQNYPLQPQMVTRCYHSVQDSALGYHPLSPCPVLHDFTQAPLCPR